MGMGGGDIEEKEEVVTDLAISAFDISLAPGFDKDQILIFAAVKRLT